MVYDKIFDIYMSNIENNISDPWPAILYLAKKVDDIEEASKKKEDSIVSKITNDPSVIE